MVAEDPEIAWLRRRRVRRFGDVVGIGKNGLLPMGMLVADMVPDNPGTWFFHCHVGPHLEAGMQTVYTVGDGPRGLPQ